MGNPIKKFQSYRNPREVSGIKGLANEEEKKNDHLEEYQSTTNKKLWTEE